MRLNYLTSKWEMTRREERMVRRVERSMLWLMRSPELWRVVRPRIEKLRTHQYYRRTA